jgi:hypothetical protein
LQGFAICVGKIMSAVRGNDQSLQFTHESLNAALENCVNLCCTDEVISRQAAFAFID